MARRDFFRAVSGTNLTRSDFAGLPLQVGIMHATLNGQIGVQFSDFSITATNFDSIATPPARPTNLALTANSAARVSVSWNAGNQQRRQPRGDADRDQQSHETDSGEWIHL